MLAHTIEDVAKEKELSQFGIIEGFDAEMVARAEEEFSLRVPNGEGKIPTQMLHAVGAPNRIRAQNQIGIRCGGTGSFAALELHEPPF